MTKYVYTERMREISGFGGGYEAACRNMVVAGLEWADTKEGFDPRWKEFVGVYGLTLEENEDAKELQEVMANAVGRDCTGAMMQAAMKHVIFVLRNGWEKYVDEMSNKEEKE